MIRTIAIALWAVSYTHLDVYKRQVGVRTLALIDEGRLIDVPFDRTLAVTGLTPDPLPVPLVKAGGRILAVLGKESS